MRRLASLVLASLVAVASLPAAAGGGQALLVGLADGTDVGPGDRFHGARVDAVIEAIDVLRVVPDDPDAFRRRALGDPAVRYVEADRRATVAGWTPDDPRYPDQDAPGQIEAPAAWNVTLGGTDRTVCLVDTGVRYTHEDLQGDRYRGGHDFVHHDDDPWDDHGHGTLTAGLAAAGLDNGVGIAGAANVAFTAAKVLDGGGTGSISDISQGIVWCADHGGDVISMSLEAPSTRTMQDAVEHAWEQGSLLVAAASNRGPCTDCILYPAAFEEVIAVTCTDDAEELCSFSSQGPEAELAAPGRDVLSTCSTSDSGYCSASGTSLSTPLVSGVAALAWTRNTSIGHAALRGMLQVTAQDLGPAGRDDAYGFGEVDAAAVVEAADDVPWACLHVSPSTADASTVVSADATCSTDPSTASTDLQARWDWTGDGTWDTGWSTDATREHRYDDAGLFDLTVQVRDADGLTDRTAETVRVDTPPTACLDASPRHGDRTTTYTFDARCSFDHWTPLSGLEARWDLDADGTWDVDWSADKQVQRTYEELGDHAVRVQIRDERGQTDVADATVTVHLLCAAGTCVG